MSARLRDGCAAPGGAAAPPGPSARSRPPRRGRSPGRSSALVGRALRPSNPIAKEGPWRSGRRRRRRRRASGRIEQWAAGRARRHLVEGGLRALAGGVLIGGAAPIGGPSGRRGAHRRPRRAHRWAARRRGGRRRGLAARPARAAPAARSLARAPSQAARGLVQRARPASLPAARSWAPPEPRVERSRVAPAGTHRSGRRPRSWRRVRSRRRRPCCRGAAGAAPNCWRGAAGAPAAHSLAAPPEPPADSRAAPLVRRAGRASGRLTGRCTVRRPGRLRLTIGRARLRLTIAWRRRVATHGCSLPLRRDALGRRPLLLGSGQAQRSVSRASGCSDGTYQASFR